MEKTDNYTLQARQAQAYFLTYDQEKLIAKCNLSNDGNHLFSTLFGECYRIDRQTGQIQRKEQDAWQNASFNEIMTILDIVCDCREDRFLTGRWNGMQNFGHQFHQALLETEDPFAAYFDKNPSLFRKACESLGGTEIPGADMGYAIEVMLGLKIAVQFWFSDEEFPAQVRYFWDENALQYIRYETMYFAVGRLKSLLLARAVL